jgi:hypothetical protein
MVCAVGMVQKYSENAPKNGTIRLKKAKHQQMWYFANETITQKIFQIMRNKG